MNVNNICLTSTGNLGEIAAIKHSLAARNDIRVAVGNWKWTVGNQFPPVKLIQKVQFWCHDRYADLRERLRRPAPILTVLPGGEFGSCQLVGASEQLAEDDDMETIWEGEGPAPPKAPVCMCVVAFFHMCYICSDK